jgi:hypothetical protein
MVRRLAWISIALSLLLVAGRPAGSAGSGTGSPRVHVAGIDHEPAADGPPAPPVPHLVRPGSERRPDAAASTAPASREGGPLAPIVVPPTFDGVPDLANASPGDPTGALGITHHLAAVNVHMAFYDRAGTPLFTPKRLRSLDPGLPARVIDFDPKVVYDSYRQVFMLVFASRSTNKSFLSLVVIPEGSEATQADWCVLHMSGDQVGGNGRQLADYPMLGFTANRVTLTTNQFDYTSAPAVGRFRYVQIVSFRKANLYNCDVDTVPIEVFGRRHTRDPDGSRAFTIVPAISEGGAPTTQFMTSMDFNGSTGKLVLWRLKPRTGGGLRLHRVIVSSGTMSFPPFGLQCGGAPGQSNRWWDTGDLRLTTGFWDNDLGRMYTATAIAGNIGGGAVESVIRWWEIDPAPTLGNSTIDRRGTVGEVGRDAAWPSVATDGDGKLWLNYARAGIAGADECLSAYAAVVQVGATAASTILFRSGEARYEFASGIERWGDYTAISRDPLDPTTMAAYGAYALDDGPGPTPFWQQVVTTLRDA